MGVDAIQSAATCVRRPRRGFTIVELLLALAITGLVSATAAAMLMAVSYGTSSKRDLRSVVVKSRVIDARIASAIRGSRAILETSTDYLILWTTDTDSDGTSDNAEVRLIERDSANDELTSYYDTGVAGDYVDAATFRAAAKSSYASDLWGTGLTAMQFARDPVTTTLVSYQLTLTAGDLSEAVVGAASARYGTVNPD